MTEWQEVALGDVCELKRGYDLPSAERRPGPVPVVSSSGVTGFHAEAKVSPPGVVTGRTGTLGEVFYVREPYWPLNTALYVRDFKGNDPRFVAALLKTVMSGQGSTTAAVPGVNRNHLHPLRVLRPDVVTQRRIGEVLRSLDDLIHNYRRRVEVLEEMARATYREWFVHFRHPGHEDASLVSSPLGPIPAGWEVRRFDEVASLVRGRSYRKHELVDTGGHLFVNLKCMMRGGGFRRDGLKRYDGKFTEAQLVKHGDVVLAVTDLTQGREILARATLVPRLPEPGVISLDVARIVPKEPADRLWLFSVLRWSDFADRVKEFANGSTVLHLSPDHVAAGKVLWPPRSLRAALASTLNPTFGLADELLDGADRLASFRDLLLPKLVTGQIDVSHLDLDVLTEEAIA
jgi:type I restriction enzyme S subunit